MAKLAPSVSSRTATFTPRELPLLREQDWQTPPANSAQRVVLRPPRPAASRIREALRRWFEEEL